MYDLDMERIEYPIGFTPLDIFISSIDKERTYDRVEGSDERLNLGAFYNSRDITLELLLQAHDTKDYRLLRDETYSLFNHYDTFYVVEEYQPGKRYLVSVDEKFIPERLPDDQKHAKVTIECEKQGVPFSESIGTTKDIQKNGVHANDRLWGFGMNLQSVDETLEYSFEAKQGEKFKVYNAGDIYIHPFFQQLKITIQDIEGSNDEFELKNDNGTVFRIEDKVDNSRVIVLDGPNITNNGIVINPRKTNRGYILLNPEWNSFTIKGAKSAKIEFDFRFNYN